VAAGQRGRLGDLRRCRAAALPLVCLIVGSPAHLAAQGGPLAPPSSGGYARLDWLLQRLTEPRRVLVIAAHPDDEDTGLLALAARGYGADAAYLSLSRGEGGQNLIGAELGIALGLLRTHELAAARAVDGARQFFTRAYDFGFTRDLAETERFWTPDSVFKDVVRVVRRFRPHVIEAVFSGTGRDGHGQHQMAGVLARRAFDAAGDPAVFPELEREEGLVPWTPLKLYGSARFNRQAATVRLPGAVLDPRLGRTVFQVAMESRSEHRSQDFGVLQPIGPAEVRLALERSRVDAAPDAGLFAGIPATAGWLGALADSLRGAVTPARIADAVPALGAALRRVRREGAPRPDAPSLLEEALAIAGGVLLDARADRVSLVPGAGVVVTLEVHAAGLPTIVWRGATVHADGPGWRDSVIVAPGARELTPGASAAASDTIAVPERAAPTQPYFLSHPMRGALYDWSGVAALLRGLPQQPPVLMASFALEIGGTPVTLTREVTVRDQDQMVGEVRRPLRVTPRVEVMLEPDTVFWPTGDSLPRRYQVTVRHHAADTTRGTVRLLLDGWATPPPQTLVLTRDDETETLSFVVRRPPAARQSDIRVRAEVADADGRTYREGATTIAYPHIRPTAWVRPAEGRIRVAPGVLPTARRIGYVRGASDRVPEALRRAGLALDLLDRPALERGDLAAYDVIVVGSRAYETDSALIAANGRVLEWVRGGGHLVVQYQQYPYIRGGFAPYRLEIAQPHDRVTDESSPVTVLVPGHPLLRRPNRIGPGDWDGWPQERGLYFAGAWDAAWRPLLELADPGRAPVRGGLLVASVGKGTYIYTGLSFFRALPAGVPGAFRLFFNLLGFKSDQAR
jgi:LmbE family N-acetylglucosaminyl deacetylase